MKDKPIIKPFISNNKYYVYDAYSNAILNIKKEHFSEIQSLLDKGLQKYNSLGKHTQEYLDIQLLINKGYFRDSFIKSIQHPYTECVERLLDRNLNELVLQVTRNCNFKCRYCLFARENEMERHHEKINMSWDIAKKSIDMLYAHSADATVIYISFYGGEPLLNFKLIKQIVEYSNNLFQSKRIHYSTTINGSLLSDEVIHFFINNNISVGISLDGPPEIQNSHRKFYETGSDTFDIVYNNVQRIRKISERYFNEHVTFQPVHMIDEDLENTNEFFKRFNLSQNKVFLQEASTSGVDYIYSDLNFHRHATNEENNSTDKESFVEALLNKQKIPQTWHHNGPCVPGIRKFFVDTYGNIFPCEKVLENPANIIGHLDSGFNIHRIKEMLNIGKYTEDDCKHCWAIRFCKMCVVDCLNVEKNTLCGDIKRNGCRKQKGNALAHLKKHVEKE